MSTVIGVNPNLIAAALDLCEGTDNTEYVRGIAELIIDTSVGLNHDEHKDELIRFLSGPQTKPITDDQRRALFAAFNEVFAGGGDNEQRYAFTRLVLRKSSDEAVSWTHWKEGALTSDEASKVLDTLNLLNV